MTTPRTIAFPSQGIAYIDGYYGAAHRAGIEVVEGVFSGGWLAGNVRRGDICHFHWPSFSYSGGTSAAGAAQRFARFLALLLIIRWRGGRLVWTAHNLLPHDRCAVPQLDRMGRHAIIALSERIAVHGQAAAQVLVEAFPSAQRKLVVIPHGHFIGLYPQDMDEAHARQACGLPAETPVVLFLGLCKPYKNVDGLIKAFRTSSLEATLMVVGRFPDPAYLQQCRQLAGNDDRIRIIDGFVADADMQKYLKAASMMVAPYREILTSGSAVLSASHGLPFVSVAKGCMLDFVTEQTGVLYPADDPAGLVPALSTALAKRWDRGAIVAHAARHRFDDAVSLLYGAL